MEKVIARSSSDEAIQGKYWIATRPLERLGVARNDGSNYEELPSNVSRPPPNAVGGHQKNSHRNIPV